MADQKLTALTASTTATTDDLLYVVDDPGGTPTSKKITFDNLQKSVDHTAIKNIGTNAHSVIDTFISSKASASGLASLDGSSKVVQDPANAQSTPAAYKIPISGLGGNLDNWITTNTRTRSFGVTLDGGGSAVSTGQKGYVTVPFSGQIRGWNITVDTGTCTFDIWKIASGTAVPTVANTITASAKPAISSGTAIHSTTLTSWTTTVTTNDIVGFNLDACSGATKITLVVDVEVSV